MTLDAKIILGDAETVLIVVPVGSAMPDIYWAQTRFSCGLVLYGSIRSDPPRPTKVVDATGISVPDPPEFAAEWDRHVKERAEDDYRTEVDAEISGWRRGSPVRIRF